MCQWVHLDLHHHLNPTPQYKTINGHEAYVQGFPCYICNISLSLQNGFQLLLAVLTKTFE